MTDEKLANSAAAAVRHLQLMINSLPLFPRCWNYKINMFHEKENAILRMSRSEGALGLQVKLNVGLL